MRQRSPYYPSRPAAAFTLIACLFANNAVAVTGLEYNLPDPPGYLTFDTVAVRVVATPNEKVPESCETKYRAGMESAFQQIWAQCQQVGKMEPSDCQRALFDRCTQLAGNMQKMESSSCLKMDGETDAIKSFQGVDNQKNSQSSTADLNRRAYVATKKVINNLQQNARDIEAQRKNAIGLLNVGACAGSTSSKAYNGLAAKVVNQLDATKAHVSSTITQRQASAKQFAQNSGVSIASLDKLVSLPPRASTITGASSKPTSAQDTPVTTIGTTSSASATSVVGQTVYVNTIVETVTGPVPSTATAISSTTSASATATAAAWGSGTVVPAPPVAQAIVLPPYVAPPEKKRINWLPILAVGIPAAAILTALAVSKDSQNRIAPSSPQDGGSSNEPNPSPGNYNPSPTNFPGGGNLAALNISVDPSFTDRQKAGIAAGLTRIPACFRYKLQGLRIINRNLAKYEGSCVAGTAYLAEGVIAFSPTCTKNDVPVGVAVHEMFHMLGVRNNNELHQKFWVVRDRHPNCPVTDYGAKNNLEDFAEAGRLLEVNDGTQQAKNSGACVNAKISELGRIMSQCPAN